jgi:hypothetical protein
VQLLERRSVDTFIEIASSWSHSSEHPLRLVVVDVFARSIAGGDENSSKDVGTAVAALQRIIDELGTGVLVVHHSGWDDSRERGSTSLRNAADSVLQMKGDAETITVVSRKQKDFADPPDLLLQRVVVEMDGMATEEGQPATSCVLVDGENAGPLDTRGGVLLEILRDVDDGEGVSDSHWKKLALEASLPERTYYRTKKQLVAKGIVVKKGASRSARFRIADQQGRLDVA